MRNLLTLNRSGFRQKRLLLIVLALASVVVVQVTSAPIIRGLELDSGSVAPSEHVDRQADRTEEADLYPGLTDDSQPSQAPSEIPHSGEVDPGVKDESADPMARSGSEASEGGSEAQVVDG